MKLILVLAVALGYSAHAEPILNAACTEMTDIRAVLSKTDFMELAAIAKACKENLEAIDAFMPSISKFCEEQAERKACDVTYLQVAMLRSDVQSDFAKLEGKMAMMPESMHHYDVMEELFGAPSSR